MDGLAKGPASVRDLTIEAQEQLAIVWEQGGLWGLEAGVGDELERLGLLEDEPGTPLRLTRRGWNVARDAFAMLREEGSS